MGPLPSDAITFIEPRLISLLRKPGIRGWISILTVTVTLGTIAWWISGPRLTEDSSATVRTRSEPGVNPPTRTDDLPPERNSVRLNEEQQRSVGLRTERVVYGAAPRVATAAGRVAPNENQYAFITPRAAGVVRSVTAHIGQEVKAGDLLATVDSPEVGEARLDLYTKLQTVEIANSQASWRNMVYVNTLELLSRLRKGETPEQVHNSMQNRAVGANRERLMTAYAEYRLAKTTIDRNRDLFAQKLITPKDFDQVNAGYESSQATYQSLMDEMGFEVKLENTKAQQALKQAETSLRVARERLRILGVDADGSEPPVEGGKVLGVDPGGIAADPRHKVPVQATIPEGMNPTHAGSDETAAMLRGTRPDPTVNLKDTPVSTYSISAPFDGTILDREMIVPGVAVDRAHRIFTMASLATVWVEADVHEGDFEMLDRIRSGGGTLRFRSPAYPDRTFEGAVIYTGDLVEEKSRSVKLLAKAENRERLLRPGMFVEVEVLSPRTDDVARIPASAILTDGKQHYVYVKTGLDSFVRREVDAETPRGEQVTIRSGLKAGDEVVVEGGYKLKAMAVQIATSQG